MSAVDSRRLTKPFKAIFVFLGSDIDIIEKRQRLWTTIIFPYTHCYLSSDNTFSVAALLIECARED
jgi:hypothetical protein